MNFVQYKNKNKENMLIECQIVYADLWMDQFKGKFLVLDVGAVDADLDGDWIKRVQGHVADTLCRLLSVCSKYTRTLGWVGG